MVIRCIFILFLISPGLFCSVDSLEITSSEAIVTQDNDIYGDLKIRISGEEWTDSSVSANVGARIDFKINVETETDYEVIAIKVELPVVNNNPMFNFIIGSVDPKPDVLSGEGLWMANDTAVVWAWFTTESFWSKEMTFSAYVDKIGSDNIDLTVIASKKNDVNYDDAYDSISFSAEKSKISYRTPYFLKIFEKFISYFPIHKVFKCLTSFWVA